jgi:hypothetical protein
MNRSTEDTAHSRMGTPAAPAGKPAAPETTLPGDGRRKLAALTSSALALPGMAGMAGSALADSPTERWTANYAYGYYREDHLPAENLSADLPAEGQSLERYQIHTNQFNVLAPITKRIDGGIDIVFESMAGASPWFVGQDNLQVMSGATISDARTDVLGNVTYYFDRSQAYAAGGISTENDYFSGNLAFGGQRSYNDKNTTLSLDFGFSWDTITPTDPDTHGLPQGSTCVADSCSKKTFALDFSFSQLLYRNATGMFSVSYKKSEGFLSDPYKKVYIPDSLGGGLRRVNDKRPEMRDQVTLMGRYRHFIPGITAAIHGDISYHWDNWGINGLSIEAAWYQTLFDIWQIIPSFRYYSQSQANFYGPVFRTEIPENYTSDYRLSPYGALSVGLQNQVTIQSWPWKTTDLILSLGYQRYMTDADWALKTVSNPSPGLVSYHLVTFRLGGRF